MIYMRSYINKVEKDFNEKDQVTQGIRQEILNCKQRLDTLEKKRDNFFEKLQYEENMYVIFFIY
jgi:hypothetical protein